MTTEKQKNASRIHAVEKGGGEELRQELSLSLHLHFILDAFVGA